MNYSAGDNNEVTLAQEAGQACFHTGSLVTGVQVR